MGLNSSSRESHALSNRSLSITSALIRRIVSRRA
jgi:hypothetical protein